MRILFGLLVSVCVAYGQVKITGVRNSASYSEVLAPGCWITIFGSNLASFTVSAASVPLPKTIGGVSVTVDGKAAALLYVSPAQINALIPYEVSAGNNRKAPLTVASPDASATTTIYINRRAPALFTRDASGTGLAHIYNANFRAVTRANPGDVVILYAAGLGPTNPPASSDAGAPPRGPMTVEDEVEVFFGDHKGEVLFAGLAPGFPGVYQINVRVPALWTDRLYLRESGWLSNITQVPIDAGTNVNRIVTAQFEQTFPEAIEWSLPFAGAQFRLEFTLQPAAKPFPVAIVGEAGGWFARVDPANGMWESFFTTPTQAAAHGDFSIGLANRAPILDYLADCAPFPGNMIPFNRMAMNELQFMAITLPPPSVILPQGWTGMQTQHGPLSDTAIPFTMTGAFGDYLNLPCGKDKTRKTQFTIYVDGRAITTKEVTVPIAGR